MNERKYRIPQADIYETGDRYFLELDMPGTSRENIEIDCDGDELTIYGKINEIESEWKPVMTEFTNMDYRRVFTVGQKVNRDTIEAKYDNGVLTIELEKAESVKPRKIEIKTA
jgi:HSP20 family protein